MYNFNQEEWDGQGDPWEFMDASFDWQEYEAMYQKALIQDVPPNFNLLGHPVARTMAEWIMFEKPMTKDDVLDTLVWVRKLP